MPARCSTFLPILLIIPPGNTVMAYLASSTLVKVYLASSTPQPQASAARALYQPNLNHNPCHASRRVVPCSCSANHELCYYTDNGTLHCRLFHQPARMDPTSRVCREAECLLLSCSLTLILTLTLSLPTMSRGVVSFIALLPNPNPNPNPNP